MKVQELFEVADSKIPYESSAGRRFFDAWATINDRMIEFTAELANDENDSWDVSFEELRRGSDDKVRSTTKKTGSGKEFEVSAFIVSALQEFISRRAPAMITFSASKQGEESRARVYKKLLDRKFSANYEILVKEKDDHAMFTMYRKD